MLKEKIKEMYFENKHTYCVPIIFSYECLTAIERVLEEIEKENPYATLDELFDK